MSNGMGGGPQDQAESAAAAGHTEGGQAELQAERSARLSATRRTWFGFDKSHFTRSQKFENKAKKGLITAKQAGASKAKDVVKSGIPWDVAVSGAYPYQISQEIARHGVKKGFKQGVQEAQDNLFGLGSMLANNQVGGSLYSQGVASVTKSVFDFIRAADQLGFHKRVASLAKNTTFRISPWGGSKTVGNTGQKQPYAGFKVTADF